ncbi:uncharacterized protein LOC143591300 isoform X3 [Bidens hawaiensis]|uniref:uncharacterized protein LOC143591300 isoform X3 n=1 Tax=Bidens hawaiensis TaxID=980011 RepID=UPI00404AB81B
MQVVYNMDESGGGAGTRGVGAGTCDGKSALAKHGGSGTRDIHIQEPNSRRSARGKDDGDNRWILRMRRKYGFGRVHRSAGQIQYQKLDGDWITFKKIPHSVLWDMFNTFRTQWRWDT